MKKIIALLLTAVMCLSLAACSSSGEKADWDYIADKGALVIGITLYEPMNYYDENNELTGFDTEFAKLVCEKLGVTPKFQIIEWEQKEVELKSKTIDVIWNGLTIKEERKENMAFSTPYLKNKQCLIMKTENAEKYTTIDTMAGASVSAESESAGQDAILASDVLSKNNFIGSAAQKDVLLEVKSGAVELGVIDYIMAKASIGADTSYADLMINEQVELAPEEYAIGVRLEDAKTLEKINGAIDELVKDGSLKALADKYALSEEYPF